MRLLPITACALALLAGIDSAGFGVEIFASENAGSTALISERPIPINLMSFAAFEQQLKSQACALGVGSVIAVVQGWQLLSMSLSLPSCLIWIYCAWLRTERQLKYINMLFSVLYLYEIKMLFLI